MGKVLVIPARPSFEHLNRKRTSDPRYIEGQRVLVQALRYLVQTDPETNRSAAEFISEHVRTNFRMSDSPLQQQPSEV